MHNIVRQSLKPYQEDALIRLLPPVWHYTIGKKHLEND